VVVSIMQTLLFQSLAANHRPNTLKLNAYFMHFYPFWIEKLNYV
jgi:hypothetical protein